MTVKAVGLSLSRRLRRRRWLETRGIKYSRFRPMASATPVTPRVTQVSIPLAASHLADLATARVEHPPLFRLSACSACRDTRIEFVKDAVLCLLMPSSPFHPFFRSALRSLSPPPFPSILAPSSSYPPCYPKNKAAVDAAYTRRDAEPSAPTGSSRRESNDR